MEKGKLTDEIVYSSTKFQFVKLRSKLECDV